MKKLLLIFTALILVSMIAIPTRAQEALTQTFIGGDASFPYSFKYPTGWQTPQKGGITTKVANKDNSIKGSFFYPNSAPGTAKEALAQYTSGYKQPIDIKALKLEDRDAARVDATIGNRSQIILMIDFSGNGQKGTIVWEGSKANLTKAESTLLAMAASFHVPPDNGAATNLPTQAGTQAAKPAATQAVTSSGGTLAIIVGQVGGSTGMGNELYTLNTGAKSGTSLKKFGTTSSAEFTKVAWSPDGSRLAYYAIDPPGLTLVDPDGGNPQIAALGSFTFAWTPDGKQITSPQQNGADWIIRNVSLSGADSQDLFTVKIMKHIDYVRWSPDGKWLAYVGTPAGNTMNGEELHIVDATGNNDQVIVPAGTIEQNAMWSTNSQKIAYIGDGGTAGTGLMTVDIASKAKKVIAAQAVAADWSPDGSQFALATRSGQLFVVSADGTNQRQITRPSDLKGQIVAIAWRPMGNPNAPAATAASTSPATSSQAATTVAISPDVQASLTETFVAKDKSFSFKYPASWGTPTEDQLDDPSAAGGAVLVAFSSNFPPVQVYFMTAKAAQFNAALFTGLYPFARRKKEGRISCEHSNHDQGKSHAHPARANYAAVEEVRTSV